MNSYARIAWPWAAFIVAMALLTQEVFLSRIAELPAWAEPAYRIGAMTLAIASLLLIALPPRRVAYLVGFIVCAGLMAWALWLQYGVGLEPCPLCIFQRVAMCAVGVVFLVALIHNPRRPGAIGYALLTLLFAGAGAALAGRHVWLQALPKDQVPACGMGLSYMMESLPFMEVIMKTLAGSGECADKGWVFLGLSIAGWTLVFFVTMIIGAFALIRRD